MSFLTTLVALAPILAVLVVRVAAVRAMPLRLALTALGAVLVWRIPRVQVAAATIGGLVVALSIRWIIFGAARRVAELHAAAVGGHELAGKPRRPLTSSITEK